MPLFFIFPDGILVPSNVRKSYHNLYINVSFFFGSSGACFYLVLRCVLCGDFVCIKPDLVLSFHHKFVKVHVKEEGP